MGYQVRRLPIVDSDGKLVGIVTMDDPMGLLVRELANLKEGRHVFTSAALICGRSHGLFDRLAERADARVHDLHPFVNRHADRLVRASGQEYDHAVDIDPTVHEHVAAGRKPKWRDGSRFATPLVVA